MRPASRGPRRDRAPGSTPGRGGPATVETLDVDITHLDAAGDGIATVGRTTIRVPYTLPGERVSIHWPRRPGALARLVVVRHRSPHRVAPACLHFGPDAQPGLGPCGGCAWQHIAYPEQLRLKTAAVTRLVRAAVPDAPAARPAMSATSDQPWHYRQKVHFVFGTSESAGRPGGTRRKRTGVLAMGHYVRGTRRLLPVLECPVHDTRGNALAFSLSDAFTAAGVNAAGPDTRGVLQGLVVRAAAHTPEAGATLVVSDDTDRRLRQATRAVLARPDAPTALHVNQHPEDDVFIFGARTQRVHGTERVREEVAGLSFLLSPTAFFQTNVAAAELLVGLVRAAVPPDATVLDLYAGVGLFALPLAAAGHRVTAVEGNAAAVEDGRLSQRANGIPEDRCRFIARPVEAALARPPRADVVVLDPPRDGCTPDVLHAVFAGVQPRVAVYVSCNPDALARDLRAIVDEGYRIRSLQPVDMFPHTAHVETVVVLDRAPIRSSRSGD